MDDIDIMKQNEDSILLRTITAASDQMGAPGAKYCEFCDEPIPAARRAALPSARLCVVCKQLDEL